jgi:hypothetical protein
MWISVQMMALVLTISPGLAILDSLRWSEPTVLRQGPASVFFSQAVASSPNGHAIALWAEYNTNPEREDLFVRILMPGGGWGPATLISQGSGYLQFSPVVAIGLDGMAIAVWQQVVGTGPSSQSHIVARKFVPNLGWSSAQVLSTAGAWPVLAISSDGRGHIIYNENQVVNGVELVARTVAPGEQDWSPPVVVGSAFSGPAALIAGNGFAYAAWAVGGTFDSVVNVALYDSAGWQPATTVSDRRYRTGLPSLLTNNGHAVISWIEETTGSDIVQWVQHLTGIPIRFTVPRLGAMFDGHLGVVEPAACSIALTPDGEVLAVCPVQGEAVPGCLDFDRGGAPHQAFYHYLQTYRHPLNGDWLGPEVISDLHRRVTVSGLFGALANPRGDALVLWPSQIPCQSSSDQLLSLVWISDEGSWRPEMTLDHAPSDVIVGGTGSFRMFWYDRQNFPNFYTADLAIHPVPTADRNGDGVIDCADLKIVRTSLGTKMGEPGFDPHADVNQDGAVDVKDLAFVAQQLPGGSQCPSRDE